MKKIAKKPAIKHAIEHQSLVVVMEGKGNPDRRQFTDVAYMKIVPCDTLQDASKLCREYITENDLGGGNWAGEAGNVYHPLKGLIAHVSYNGRVWDGDYGLGTTPKEFTGDDLTKKWDVLFPAQVKHPGRIPATFEIIAQGNPYKAREFKWKDHDYIVASTDLSELVTSNLDDEELMAIDNTIVYYVSEEEMLLPVKQLAKLIWA